MTFTTIDTAITELREGRMVILVDDENREQEGDLVLAAEKVTPASLNFMIQYARGLVCLTVTEEFVQRLQIPLMPERHKNLHQAWFTISIEAVDGVSSGVSVYDRAQTIRVAVDPNSKPKDIGMPGHIFPIQARKGGVFERAGHTEGSVDLVRLTGLQPCAVICEIMKEDGRMARPPDLIQFGKTHHIPIVAIHDLIAYLKTRKTHAVI
ncbi:MAG: Riboflavin biosynthesis protein ribAB [uncultured bacterium]|nr:MAG: Riboflavin biosynthesis protein ribAB [uncultured bacterium]